MYMTKRYAQNEIILGMNFNAETIHIRVTCCCEQSPFPRHRSPLDTLTIEIPIFYGNSSAQTMLNSISRPLEIQP